MGHLSGNDNVCDDEKSKRACNQVLFVLSWFKFHKERVTGAIG